MWMGGNTNNVLVLKSQIYVYINYTYISFTLFDRFDCLSAFFGDRNFDDIDFLFFLLFTHLA